MARGAACSKNDDAILLHSDVLLVVKAKMVDLSMLIALCTDCVSILAVPLHSRVPVCVFS